MIFDWLRRLVSNPVVRDPAALPRAGDIYSFQTAPFEGMEPTGRYAALKVIHVDGTIVSFAVLDGIWGDPPSFDQCNGVGILTKNSFANGGRSAVYGTQLDWWDVSVLTGMTFLGSASLRKHEIEFARSYANRDIGTTYSTLHAANYSAEGEWRWANDRDQFLLEHEANRARKEAQQRASAERYRNRLAKLTFDQLLAETPFERWSPSPPFPPQEFVIAARELIYESCRKLRALGAKPKKADVRQVLKAAVERFNVMDEAAGGVIETEEREDICAVLEEMAYAAKQKSVVAEIDSWRNW